MSQNPEWTEQLPVAVTLIDIHGIIREMNARARETFAANGGAALIGTSVYDCHPAHASDQIRAMMQTQQPNHYTISKGGRRKIIHQIPWYDGGQFAGLVEISIPIPETMPHFERG
jgi:transcriptional regulator with PAS, ATPase and Fis domain